MIAIVQRVSEASVEVATVGHAASIGAGLCVLLGVETGDGTEGADWMARKLAHLRIFRDENDKMNRSVTEAGGEILLISQFTLAGDCSQGNRPSFTRAAEPAIAKPLYERVATLLREAHGLTVRTGIFGGTMTVRIINDGPVTLIVRTP